MATRGYKDLSLWLKYSDVAAYTEKIDDNLKRGRKREREEGREKERGYKLGDGGR